jgi:hypothetical protein
MLFCRLLLNQRLKLQYRFLWLAHNSSFRCSAASDNERFALTDATRAPKRRDVDGPASKSQSTIFPRPQGGKRWLSSLRLLKIRAFWLSINRRYR